MGGKTYVCLFEDAKFLLDYGCGDDGISPFSYTCHVLLYLPNAVRSYCMT